MAKYKYSDLIKTYGGFISPAYSITINNSDKLNQTEKPFINEIEVELTAGYEASSCLLSIFKGVSFDATNKTYQVDEFISTKLKLGTPIEVSLGYLNSLQSVFKGIITRVELSYQGSKGFEIQIECMDAKRLMMNNFRSLQPKQDLKKNSEAVKEVLKKYAKHVGKQNIGDTPEKVLTIEQHNQSDYSFIVALAKQVNYAFYIVKDEVFFQEIGSDTESLIELHADSLKSFSREISLSDQLAQVTVRANDESDPNTSFEHTAKDIKAVGKGTKGLSDITKIIDDNYSKTIIDPSIRSANEAKARAEAELAKHAFKFAQGSFNVMGMPELVPGKMVTIKGFGPEYDNDYYLKKIVHRISAGGFNTRGELGVNKI